MPSADQSMTIKAFQALIHERYYKTDAARGAPGTFLWFTEEIGELASAIAAHGKTGGMSSDERANLEEEFADVLAWLATLANITGVDLAEAVSKYTVPGRVQGVKE